MNRYRVERLPSHVDVSANNAEEALKVGVLQLRTKDAGPFRVRGLVQVEQPTDQGVEGTVVNLNTGAVDVNDRQDLRELDRTIGNARQP